MRSRISADDCPIPTKNESAVVTSPFLEIEGLRQDMTANAHSHCGRFREKDMAEIAHLGGLRKSSALEAVSKETLAVLFLLYAVYVI